MRLLSPVFFKETSQLAASRRPVAMKAIVLGLLFLDFLIVLGTYRESYEIGSGELGLALFTSLGFVQLVAMTLFTPVVTAGMVCGEKQANTLGLLFLTRLKAVQIVQDKGLSRILFMLYVCVVTLPFMFAALLFGGVEARQIIVAAANIFAVILLCGGISLLSSTLLKRYTAALAVAFSAVFLYLVMLPMLVGICGELWSFRSGRVIAALNPFCSLAMSLDPYQMRTDPLLAYSWVPNLVVGGAVYILGVALASGLLRRVAFPGAYGRNRLQRTAAALSRLFLALHPSRLFSRGATVDGNPVFWKESDLLHDHLKLVLIRIVDVLAVVYLGMLLIAWIDSGKNALDDEELHMVAHFLAFALLGMFTAVLAAGAFARERESGTLEVLLTTRLSGRTIVLGTFFGLVRSILPFVLAILAVIAIGAVFSDDVVFGIVPIVNIVVYYGFILAVGMHASLACRTTVRAIAWTLGAMVTLTVAVPLLGLMTQDGDVSQAFIAITPIYWIAMGPHEDLYSDDMCGGWIGYLVVTSIYAIIAVAMVGALTRSFDRRVGRQASEDAYAV